MAAPTTQKSVYWLSRCLYTAGNLLALRGRAGFGPRPAIHAKPMGQILPAVVVTQLRWPRRYNWEQKWARERWGTLAQGRDGHNCFQARLCCTTGMASCGNVSGAGLALRENYFKFVAYFKDSNRCRVASCSCFGALCFKLFYTMIRGLLLKKGRGWEPWFLQPQESRSSSLKKNTKCCKVGKTEKSCIILPRRISLTLRETLRSKVRRENEE